MALGAIGLLFVASSTTQPPWAQNIVKPRAFYLTATGHDGAAALTACAAGFHMASLWEIHDPSHLRYDVTLGLTTDDSGSGPPTAVGWIRTATAASGFQPAGRANCHAWASFNSADFGSVVALSAAWFADGVSSSPWLSAAEPCSTPQPVWCVED